MSDRIFIDSNVFVYSIDDDDLVKQASAKRIVSALSENDGNVSTQVLQEFYNVITSKLKCPKDKAKLFVEHIANFIFIKI